MNRIIRKTDKKLFPGQILRTAFVRDKPGTVHVVRIEVDELDRLNPGDIIIGDADGIVIVKPEQAEEICSTASKVEEKETEIKRKIVEEGSYIRPWVEEKLKQNQCVYL